MRTVNIDVISDTVCPWCYVGKLRLEKAMAQFSDVDFQVRWFPFQLNASASVEGINKMEMYKEKFGEARIQQMLPYMTQVFQDLGVSYSVGGLTGNSFDSHRLIHWAGETAGSKKQNQLVEELFLNYFSQEKFINDRSVLVAAADKVGLSGAAEYLADPTNGQREVQQLLATKARAVTGVPFFIVGSQIQLNGAQETETFVKAINQVLNDNN